MSFQKPVPLSGISVILLWSMTRFQPGSTPKNSLLISAVITGYFGVHEKLRTAQTDREGDALLDYLTSEMFPDLDTLIAFCESNGKDFQGVWLYVECDLCNYAVRIIPMKNNYNLYLYQYIK